MHPTTGERERGRKREREGGREANFGAQKERKKRKGNQNSEQCESRGGRPVLPVLNTVIVLVVSVDVKQHLKKKKKKTQQQQAKAMFQLAHIHVLFISFYAFRKQNFREQNAYVISLNKYIFLNPRSWYANLKHRTGQKLQNSKTSSMTGQPGFTPGQETRFFISFESKV